MANNRNQKVDYNGIAKLKNDAVRFFKNGVATIKKVREHYGIYDDLKYVHEGSSIIYRGVLSAVDAVALGRGVHESKLPKNVPEVREFLKKRSASNGKVLKAFNELYRQLHLIAYYGRDEEVGPEIVNLGISNARFVIEKLTGRRVS